MTSQVSPPAGAEGTTTDEERLVGPSTNGATVDSTRSGMPLLHLTTIAATGQTRTTPVPFNRDFSRLIIAAVNHDSSTYPHWYHDIVVNPNVTVEAGGERFRAVARIVEGPERERLLGQIVSERPNVVETQFETSRQFPLIVLERVLDRTTNYSEFNRNLIEEFRARGGKVGGIFEELPLLLLTTTGAKSGKPRIAPLVFGVDGERLIIVASKGGSPTNPDWYHNIVADPKVTVDLGTEIFPARATVVEDPERQRLFDRVVAITPRLAETRASTARQLPVILLERAA